MLDRLLLSQLFRWSFGSHDQWVLLQRGFSSCLQSRLWLSWRAITSTALLPAASILLHHRGRIENIGGWRCGHISSQYRFHVRTRIFNHYFLVFMMAQRVEKIKIVLSYKKGRATKIFQHLAKKCPCDTLMLIKRIIFTYHNIAICPCDTLMGASWNTYFALLCTLWPSHLHSRFIQKKAT